MNVTCFNITLISATGAGCALPTQAQFLNPRTSKPPLELKDDLVIVMVGGDLEHGWNGNLYITSPFTTATNTPSSSCPPSSSARSTSNLSIPNESNHDTMTTTPSRFNTSR